MSSEAIETLAVQNVTGPLAGKRPTLRVEMPEALPQVAGDKTGERLGLYLEGVEPSGSGTTYEVYANLPSNAEPQPAGPHYLGTLAIFGPKGEAGAKIGYDITPLVKNGEEDLVLTFIRRGLELPKGQTGPATVPEAPPLKIKQVRIVRE